MDPIKSEEDCSSHVKEAVSSKGPSEKIKFPENLNIFEQVETINDDAISAAAKKVNEFYESIRPLEMRLNHSKKMLQQIKMNKPAANGSEEESVDGLDESAENLTAIKRQVADAQEELESANSKFVESLGELRRLLHPDYFEFICAHFRMPAGLGGLQWPQLERNMWTNFNPLYSVFADIKALDDWVVMALFWKIHQHRGRLKQLKQHCTKVDAEMKSCSREPDFTETEELMENLKTQINLCIAAISERTPPDLLARFCQVFNITKPPPNCYGSITRRNATTEKPLPDDKSHVLAEINGFGLKKVNELTMKVNNIRDEIAAQRKAHHFHLRCKDLKIYPPYLSWQPKADMEEKSPALVTKQTEKHLSEHIVSIQREIQKLEAELNDCIALLKELLPPNVFNRYCKYYGGDVEFDISEAFRITPFKVPKIVSAPAENSVVEGSGKKGMESRLTEMAQNTKKYKIPKKVQVAVKDSNFQNQLSSNITVGVGSAQQTPPPQLQNADEPLVMEEINALGNETVSQLALKVKELRGMVMLAHKQKLLKLEASQNQISSSQVNPHAEKAANEVWNYVKKLEVERKQKMFVLKQLLPPDLYKRYYQCFGGRVAADLQNKLKKPKTSVRSVLDPSESLACKTPFSVNSGFQFSTAIQKTRPIYAVRSQGGFGRAPGNPSSQLKTSWSSTFGKRRLASEVTKRANAIVAKVKRAHVAKWKQTTGMACNVPLGKLKLDQVRELAKTLHPKLPPSRLDLYSVRKLPISRLRPNRPNSPGLANHRRDSPARNKRCNPPVRNNRHVGIDGLFHSELRAANSLVLNPSPQLFDYGHTTDSVSAKLGISEMLGAVLQPQLGTRENYLVTNPPEQKRRKNIRSSPSRKRRAVPSSRSPGRRNIRSSPSSRRRAIPSSHSPRRRNIRSSPSPKRRAIRSSRTPEYRTHEYFDAEQSLRPEPISADYFDSSVRQHEAIYDISRSPDHRSYDYFDEDSLQLKSKTGLGLDSPHQRRHRARAHQSRSPEHHHLEAEQSLQFDRDAELPQRYEHGTISRRLRSPDSARHHRHRSTAHLSPSPNGRFSDNFDSERCPIPYRSLSFERGHRDLFDAEFKNEDDFCAELPLHPELGIRDGYFISDMPLRQESVTYSSHSPEYSTRGDVNSGHSVLRRPRPDNNRISARLKYSIGRTPPPRPRNGRKTPPPPYHRNDRKTSSPPQHRNGHSTQSLPYRRRGRTPPKHRSGRTPPKGRSGRTPPKRRSGRTPPKGRSGRTPPKHRSDRTPPKGRSGRTPPKHRSGRTPPKHRSGRTPPSQRRDHRNTSHSLEDKINDNFDEELLRQICDSKDYVTVSSSLHD